MRMQDEKSERNMLMPKGQIMDAGLLHVIFFEEILNLLQKTK